MSGHTENHEVSWTTASAVGAVMSIIGTVLVLEDSHLILPTQDDLWVI